jgi:hypothetical protein
MDERNQSSEGRLVALPPFEKEPGDLRGVVRNAAILGLFRPVEVFATLFRFLGRGNRGDQDNIRGGLAFNQGGVKWLRKK